MAHGPAYLPSEGIIKDVVIRDAVSVSSSDGEMIFLHEKVRLNLFVIVMAQYIELFSARYFKFCMYGWCNVYQCNVICSIVTQHKILFRNYIYLSMLFDNQWNKPYLVKKLQNHDNFKTLIIQHFQEFYVLLIR